MLDSGNWKHLCFLSSRPITIQKIIWHGRNINQTFFVKKLCMQFQVIIQWINCKVLPFYNMGKEMHYIYCSMWPFESSGKRGEEIPPNVQMHMKHRKNSCSCKSKRASAFVQILKVIPDHRAHSQIPSLRKKL